MKIDRTDPIVRYAIWEAHNKTCFYSGKPITEFSNLQLDHIIPIDMLKYPNKLNSLIDKLGLKNFNIHGLENLIPCRGHENRKKNAMIFNLNQLILPLKTAEMKVEKIEKLITKYKKETSYIKSIATIKSIAEDKNDYEYVYNQLNNDETFFTEKESYIKGHFSIYSKSLKRVSVNAHLPTPERPKGNCLFSFQSINIRGAMITLDHEDIINNFIDGLYSPIDSGLRRFIVCPHQNDNYYIQLGNNRFLLNKEEILELCVLVYNLSQKYLECLSQTENILGTIKFKYGEKGFRLIKVTWELWNMLVEYQYKYNYENNSKNYWNIFSPNPYFIRIYTENHSFYNDGLHAIFKFEEDFTNSFLSKSKFRNDVWITWEKPSSIYFSNYKNEISKKNIWSADDSFYFLTKQLIPKVFYDNITKNEVLNLFSKKSTYKKIIQNFKISNYIWTNNIELIDASINTKENLFKIVDCLQRFFSLNNQMYLEENQCKDLYTVIKTIIKFTKNIPISYFSGNLNLKNVNTKHELLNRLDRIIDAQISRSLGSF